MSNKLPWEEAVALFSIHPDAASRHDVARLAADLMDLMQASAAPASGEGLQNRYEAQHMKGASGDYRITDKTTDSRVATCYLKENANLVVNALNALSLREWREGMVFSEDARLTIEHAAHILEFQGGDDNAIAASDLRALLASAPSAGGKEKPRTT
jgi:hypothetical protein